MSEQLKNKRSSKVTLEVPDEEQILSKVVLAKFEHGRLKPGMWKSLDYTYKDVEKDVEYHGVKKKRTSKVLTIPVKENLSYVGCSSSSDGKQGPRYYVGCLNKKTGKMSIHDADVFHMKPKFEDEKKSEHLFEDELTSYEKIDRLNAAFGSSKQKRNVQNKWKFAQEFGKDYSTSLDKTLHHAVSRQEVKHLTAVPVKEQLAETSIHPPMNKDASCPSDVYSFKDMLSSQAMIALKTPAEMFFKRTREQLEEWTESEKFYGYVLEQLKIMPMEESKRWERAKALIFMQYLLQLFHMKPRDLKARNCLPEDWPQAIREDLLKQFTVTAPGSVRFFPARLKDKLLLHILTMSLILENMELDPAILIQDLCVAQKQVNRFYKVLGCFVRERSKALKKFKDEPPVQLTLPLNLLAERKRPERFTKKNLRK